VQEERMAVLFKQETYFLSFEEKLIKGKDVK